MMIPIRKRRLYMIIFMLFVLILVTTLVLYALRQNISLFYSPSQAASGQAPTHHSIRIGGMVVPGSVVRSKKNLSVQFKITDYQANITVAYHGILPDLFREGQGIVAEGVLIDNTRFMANEVLAKHDENYMPPEVKQILKAKVS